MLPPEAPPEYVAFVARTLPAARAAAARLVGSDRDADEVYPLAFADVATLWRWRRLVDLESLLHRRLLRHAAHWREDQVYAVEVLPEARNAIAPAVTHGVSMALRKASLLPSTVRREWVPVAEAAIAWAGAYRRHQLLLWTRLVLTALLVVVLMTQLGPAPPS